MRFLKTLLSGSTACLLATGAAAETLPVAGIYPAGEDAPSQVREIAIDRFGGNAGEELAFAIEDRLRRAVIDGEPWFDIRFNTRTGGVVYVYDSEPGPEQFADAERLGPESLLRGFANVEVNEVADGTKDVERCTQRDDQKNCIAKAIEAVECRALTVSLRPDIRLMSREGRTLYADRDFRTATQRYCADETTAPSVDAMVGGLIDEYVNRVRSDLAPVQLAEAFRVLENRKGLSRADSKAFRDAVRLTKNDPYGACLEFGRLEATNPDHTSVLFNIGLCHESAGDLDAAEDYYRRTLAIRSGTGYAQSGLGRIASRRRAEEQMAIHYAGEDGE